MSTARLIRRAAHGGKTLTRRGLLGGLAAGAAAGLMPARALAAACTGTATQSTGPFYPVAIQNHDWDLTRVEGGTGPAAGEIVELSGRVITEGCGPLADAIVEIWQANTHGRYDHPDDPNPAPLDPNFQGYGRFVTDSEGNYRFLTIKPGAYPVNFGPAPGWVRPPHIHFTVRRTFAATPTTPTTLTTQMYFAGDPLNDVDLLLSAVPEPLRGGLVIDFADRREDGIPRGRFDLVMTNAMPLGPERNS